MKSVKRAAIILSGVISLLAVIIFFYMRHPQFGKAPAGKRLELLKKSAHYKDGKFQNAHFTPTVTEGYSMSGVIFDFIFRKFPRTRPAGSIPSVKTDLKNLPPSDNVLVWFGHSSYFIQLDGKRFLVDPVFSGNASPIPNSNRSFKGTDVYSAEDMPEIDFLLITHDHYDHLDYPTVMKLKPKIKQIVCGLGVGEHFEYWKFESSKIIEKDWNESVVLDDNITLHTAPARHFSGRSFTRNNTLWLSFILQTPGLKLYLGGDSGYDTHFAEIGKRFGGFDLALLDNGQYNLAWQAIHMLPREGLQAAKDLHTKRLFPVHSSKFKLANHPWDEPLRTITELNEKEHHIPLVTPRIGEIVRLNDSTQTFTKWWEHVK
ncbi:MBL fold metallo-hydrolase [Pararcticibacter amylolyticus]|uniref:MBL fold metallo-hydrolase n=1 Tax=Pararcticibacter amylolyticus TaxID=2173175 RepID=A0A2U2PM09_9SPHI|nr:MBL fold metallo-hydrolase [Pararcticibacter amylolyticus]PWG82446.1 MBL fold metallo-hydrolase [Pararcticibacter amylolyticus]